MAESPGTRSTLLHRIRDPRDTESWKEFIEIYTPLVRGYYRRRGLQDADAADVTQDVLQAIAMAIRKFEYDPERGSFRGWLRKVIRSKLNNFLAKRAREPQGSGDTGMIGFLAQQPSREQKTEWGREFKEYLFQWAARKIRDEFEETTWQAFWQTAVENKPAKQVAESLGMTLGALYTARSRVKARLREQIQDVSE